MKVFVDELSKTCDECPCRNEFFCSLTYERLSYSSLNYKRGNECPLELIADHDKEKDQQNKELERKVAELTKRNAELQEQLNNAIVPKFKVGQEIFAVISSIIKGKIEKITTTINKLEDENLASYSITDSDGYALRLPEEQIFATEEEAKQHFKEIK